MTALSGNRHAAGLQRILRGRETPVAGIDTRFTAAYAARIRVARKPRCIDDMQSSCAYR